MLSILKHLIFISLLIVFSCGKAKEKETYIMTDISNNDYELATIGGGCFWCIEAIFTEVRGIISATSGFSGGTVRNPSYREVVTGKTGHAEVVQLKYDPSVISYEQILTVFFHLHDPTTLNRQGADIGTHYRSVIFYHNEEQETIAKRVFDEIDGSDLWSDPLVTEISPMNAFYVAEDYHQNYFQNNPNQPYCTYVIGPKMHKLRSLFKDKLN